MASESIEGKTLRFHFTEGAMKGRDFDHIFLRDSVKWGPAGSDQKTESKGAIVSLGDERYVGSYMSEQGHTLTSAINMKTGELDCFASDGKNWSKHRGSVK